jgi:hypothetical protein
MWQPAQAASQSVAISTFPMTGSPFSVHVTLGM